MDVLSRPERAFGSPLDARDGTPAEELAETEVGKSWQSWCNDGRSDRWLENVVPLLGRRPGTRALLEISLLLLVVRGWRAIRDFGMSHFRQLICAAMDSVTAEFAACFLHDSPSPKLLLVGLSVKYS